VGWLVIVKVLIRPVGITHNGPDRARQVSVGRGSAFEPAAVRCPLRTSAKPRISENFGAAEYDRRMAKDFRFGLGLFEARSRPRIQDAARWAEDLGYDVMHVPDHLRAPAPFPVMMAAAMATRTLRLGTFVLNTGFYKPALLARDAAAMRDLSEGRFELGLGTVTSNRNSRPPNCPIPPRESG